MENKDLYCCQYCGKNWEVVQQQLNEFKARLLRVEEGMEIELVSSDEPDQSTLSFRRMEP